MRAMTIAEFMSGATQDAQRPLPEAQAATLMEEFARYAEPCPFKPGDLITPRKTSSYSKAGQPHIVLEVLAEPIRSFEIGDDITDIFAHAFGQRLDIRVAVISDEGIVLAFMQESWKHEKYTGPMPHLAG